MQVGGNVLVYWLKVKGSGYYEPVFMGELRKLNERELKRLFLAKNILCTKTTGIAIVKVVGIDSIVIELYENGIQAGMTQRVQERKTRTMLEIFEDARKHLKLKKSV